jgi:hypothetical protein
MARPSFIHSVFHPLNSEDDMTALLTDEQLAEMAPSDVIQCDQHRRDRNERAAQAQIDARYRLILRFAPFIWLEDQNLEPVTLMETVAARLLAEAEAEKIRREEAAADLRIAS